MFSIRLRNSDAIEKKIKENIVTSFIFYFLGVFSIILRNSDTGNSKIYYCVSWQKKSTYTFLLNFIQSQPHYFFIIQSTCVWTEYQFTKALMQTLINATILDLLTLKRLIMPKKQKQGISKLAAQHLRNKV